MVTLPPPRARRAGAVVAVIAALSIPFGATSCCGGSAFTRNIQIDAGPLSCCLRSPRAPYDLNEPLGPHRVPLPRIGLRVGDTATFRARAEETYFGDSGCVPAGPLAPFSTTSPNRYHWYPDDRSKLSVQGSGHVRALQPGTHVLNAELDDPQVRGRALVAVVPWFDSVAVWAARDTVWVGDTVSLLAAAYAGGELVPEITTDSALLGPTFSLAAPFFNTIHGHHDESPVRFVVTATTPAIARVRAVTGIHSARHLVGTNTFVILDTVPASAR